MSTSGFAFPQIYHFPPFFTRQSHEETWTRQRKMWGDLILAYAEAKRLFELDIGAESTLSSELFSNTRIDRKPGSKAKMNDSNSTFNNRKNG